MQGHLTVAVHENERSTVLSLDGELDLASAVHLDAVLSRVASATGQIVIDLERLRFIDVAGLRALLAASERAEREGRRLALINVGPPVQRLLALAQATDLLPVLEG